MITDLTEMLCFTVSLVVSFHVSQKEQGMREWGDTVIGFLHDQRIWRETTHYGWWMKSYTGKDSWPRVWYIPESQVVPEPDLS